jgi:hypothetical protein
MSLKYKLDSLDGLDDATKALYEKKGDKFVLKVEGVEDGDAIGLKNKVQELLAEVGTLKGKVKENADSETAAKEAARKAAEDAAAKKGDIEALRKSADDRVAAAIAETEGKFKPTVEKQSGTIRKLLVDNVATSLAGKIGLKGSEQLLIPHITNRLAVEERDGEFVTVIRDSTGKASALTVADLEKEFVGNAAFAPVIAGSKASGSGAGGDQSKGGGAAGAKSIKRADFNQLDPASRMQQMKDGVTVTVEYTHRADPGHL